LDRFAETASVALISIRYRRIDTEKPDTATRLFANSFSHARTTNRSTLAARALTEFFIELRIATIFG